MEISWIFYQASIYWARVNIWINVWNWCRQVPLCLHGIFYICMKLVPRDFTVLAQYFWYVKELVFTAGTVVRAIYCLSGQSYMDENLICWNIFRCLSDTHLYIRFFVTRSWLFFLSAGKHLPLFAAKWRPTTTIADNNGCSCFADSG